MGRRRRKVVRPPKKKLPNLFLCPACGEESINVLIFRETNLARIKCSKCGIIEDISLSIGEQPIDIYCKFTDRIYSGSLKNE